MLRKSAVARWSVIGLVVCPALAHANAEQPLDTLVRQTLAQHQSLRAVQATIRSLQHRVDAAGAWRDPKVAVDYSNMPIDRWAPGGHPMSGIQFRLQQTFLYPGKTALREAEASGKIKSALASLDEAKLQLATAVKRSYYRLVLVRQLRQVTQKHIALVKQFLAVVKTKYVVGKAGQHDMLRLQVLQQKLADELQNFDRDERELLARINAGRRKPVALAIATPSSIDALAASALPSLNRRPLLRVHQAQAEAHLAAAKRADKESYPDFTTWVGYRIRVASNNDKGTDFVGFGFSMPLPLFSKKQASGTRNAHRELSRAALARYDALRDNLRGKLAGVMAAWQRAATQAKTYQNKLMPLAQKALDATFNAYQVDRADFASLYQAELQLLSFERVLRTAQVATHLHRTAAESLAGPAKR